MHNFVEYEHVSTSAALAQGDVLEAVGDATMWNRRLIVVTADCDLAHEKHQGRITCVPVLTAEEYLLGFQVSKQFARMRRSACSKVLACFAKNGSPNLTAETLEAWVNRAGVSAVLKALDPSSHRQARGPLEAIDLLQTEFRSVDEALDAGARAAVAEGRSTDIGAARRALADAVRQAFKSTPGDAQFISSVSPECEEGYFVFLRHMEQLWEPDIALGPVRRVTSHRRVARLRDRYAHSLVLRFAQVFLAIGLPDEYESNREDYSKMIVKERA